VLADGSNVDVPHPPAAGWFPDPWGPAGRWRWWSGTAWTANTVDEPRKPRLPAWLSVPVIVAAVPMVPFLGIIAVLAPVAVVLGVVPALIVCPVLIWLDRVEPEPWPARIHAFLWGALVATGVALVINTLVGLVVGEAIAAVVSAPLVEEGFKAAAILYAVRRHEVDGIMDGVVYAGWVAIGFAVVEDMLFFADALDAGMLVEVFIARALLSPFAHPLFTAWIGIAIGWAVINRKPVLLTAVPGYAIAVFFHALWNGSLVNAENMGGELFLIVTVVLFFVLFVSVAITLYLLRKREERRFVESIPWLSARYGVPQAEAAVFGDFRRMLVTRRSLPKPARKRFDAVHAALARLSLLHQRPDGADHESEARLVDQLQQARR
jgi:protease PrsW